MRGGLATGWSCGNDCIVPPP